MKPLYDSLGFELTTGQQNAVNDILSSMRGGTDIPAMDRLLQGDVGSGKTAVAFASAYEVLKNNYNVLMMAPTEILANQHYEKAKRLFAPLGIETVLITASVKAKERKEAEEKCRERANGCGVFAIGTHALITDKTNIPDVALVITDEQHRFGVVQRERLREKSLIPHTLMMTATPIPRTMAMFFYSRKDVSVLGELPSGRKPIETVVCSMEEQMKSRVYGFIKKHLDEGGRAYIVCPLISENENTPEGISDCICEYMSASDFFGEEDTALLHGRMTASEKDNAMASFASGEKRVLVTTTVIEVGVDVPEATLMVIENADRFGLAQLHQLRGRVGRGQKSSYCVLMSSNNSEKSRTRLQIMKNERDGMKLAEYDLKTRGPGDFLGVRQSGEPLFELGSFATEEMVEELLSLTDE